MRYKFIVAAGLLILTISVFSPINTTASYNNPGLSTDTTNIRTYSIIGVGDIMLGTSFPSKKYLPPHNDPYKLLEYIADTLRSADITIGNLEGSFLDDGEPFKKCRDTTICYLFRMPEKYASVLKQTGFDMISLANNHFGDFGLPAAVRTRELLDSLGIKFAGPLEDRLAILDKDSVSFGYCAFSPTAGAVSICDLETAGSIVKSLADSCDIVIVSFHGGAEGSDYQRVPKKDEIFYGENRGNVFEFAHRMIDMGADVVMGSGPHVTRAVELYKERFISYSLGNFCTYGRFNLTGPNGYAPVMNIKIDGEGRFISGKIIPVFQGYDGKVRPDTLNRVIKKIKELTALDFPDTDLNISDDGQITYK
jgi:poly-gamma-glutamate capsule biosynthesis protein CapA/YwtB (metallophosphatase superfamily)